MTLSIYSISTMPEEVLILVMQHFETKDLCSFSLICARFQKLTLKYNHALLGYQNWPYQGRFKQMKRIDPKSLDLCFECENFSKLKRHIFIFSQIASHILPQGAHGKFEVHGQKKQTLDHLPYKMAACNALNGSPKEYLPETASNWSLYYEWRSNLCEGTQFRMIGVIKKISHKEPHFLGEQGFYYRFPKQFLTTLYKNLPKKKVKNLQKIIYPLFMQSVCKQSNTEKAAVNFLST